MTLVFGEIISINGTRAKLKLYDYDTLESIWVHIPQRFTVKNKSFSIMEIGTEVAAILTERHDDGCIIGGIYNDVDIAVTNNNNENIILFSDGSEVKYNEETHQFTLNIKGDAYIKSENPLILDCDVNIKKSLTVDKDVTDKNGSMQEIRNIYNTHTHLNNANGANTSTPNTNIS